MKRVETLVRLAKQDLYTNQYREFSRNGVWSMDIARALDKIRDAQRVLRTAYGA